jgi:long-chain acyl-CoA synthetase
MNIAELALKSVETGEHTSIIFEGQEITNKQMNRASNKLGNALTNLGVQRGDRIILQMPNCPEVLQSFQAISKIGAIIVPISYQVGQEEINFIYQDAGATAVITSPEFYEKVNIARSKVAGLDKVIIVGSEAPAGAFLFHKLVDDASDELEMVETADDETAVLVYTSGTTGTPKGVMLTHAGLHFAAVSQQESCNLPQDLVTIAILPLCHAFGIAMMNGAFLRLHGKVVLMRQFNLENFFENVQKYRVQSVPAVPTMYVYMTMYPDPKKYDLSSVKIWLSGSAPLPLETSQRFKEKFGGEIVQGWGLTETGANNTSNVHVPNRVGSIGQPMNGIEMKVFDDNQNEMPQGKEGEIVVGGPVVMKGYWNRPEMTAEIVRNGWLHTGDIGYVDQDGYFFITDRKKDIIIKGGENISPRSIEEVLYNHPAVAEAAVVGMKDTVYGEDIKAFVTLKPGDTATPGELIEFCQGKLKNFFVPKEVVIIPAMPKTLVGKILKKELRKM